MNVLDVGKYKGRTFEYIERNDPGYSKWVLSLESPTNRTLEAFSKYLRNKISNGNIKSELGLSDKYNSNEYTIINKSKTGNSCSYLELNKEGVPNLVIDCKSENGNFKNQSLSGECVAVVKNLNMDIMKVGGQKAGCIGNDFQALCSNSEVMQRRNSQLDNVLLESQDELEDILQKCDKELEVLVQNTTVIANGLNTILSYGKMKLDCGIVFSLVSPTMFRISSEKNNKSQLSLPRILGDYLKEYKLKENIASKKMRTLHTGMQGIDLKPYCSTFIFPGIYYEKLIENISDRFECQIIPIPDFILDRFPDFKKYEIEDFDADFERISNLTPKYNPDTVDLPDCNLCKGCIYDNVCYSSLNHLKCNYPELYNSLRPFQKVGILVGLKKQGRILIGDEMGLGKTLQALSIITYFRQEWPVLVICPSSIRFQWYQQALDWLSPEINKSNITLIRTSNDTYSRKSKIIIISYDLITRNEHFRSFFGSDFQVVIADESHFLKNSTAKRTQMIVPLLHKARRTILLSGTPALNNPTELYEQINAIVKPSPQFYSEKKNKTKNNRNELGTRKKKKSRIKKLVYDSDSNLNSNSDIDSANSDNISLLKAFNGNRLIKNNQEMQKPPNVVSPKFPSYLDFAKRYSDTRINKFSHRREFYGSRNTEELHLFIRESVMIRRLKKQVLHELPPKQRSKIPLEIRDKVGIKKIQELLADPNCQTDLSNFDEDGSSSSMCNLHKLTCEIKINPVQEYIEYLLEYNDDKYVIFGHHHVMLDAIESVLLKKRKTACNSGGPFLFIRIDGKTPGNKREEYVKEFQNNENCKVALLSITACGQGLNLTSAGTVIFAELYWVPGTMLQAEDRCHRMGTQYSCINIHYLIAEETLDDKMWGTLCRKQKIMASTLDGIDQRKNDIQHFHFKQGTK
ncbi:HARP like SWI SNF ATpase [Cryptosporidium sp. chipmunk genotype I]|uniref:HARP like SWI SNF ATpase n=1 Tax=Cryptosporidium sp. chipmunk genotype I TaxID=1280935 RepID=UPI003519DD02|nr:HARP like SWI SNF ATpase [Cryptosporidium sp. chipmunk genotype I]